ncbi:MAG: ABC transporter transmembrane domain-containing protein, partial [Parachlamydiaceae bacterium]
MWYNPLVQQTLFSHLVSIVRNNIGSLSVSFILITLANVLLISNPLLMRYAIEHQLNPWSVTPFLILIAFISAYLRYVMRLTFVKVSRKEEREMRAKIYKKISSQTMAFFDRHGIGELTSRLSSDISSYRDVLGPGLLFPVYFITTVIPGMIALFWLAPKLAWIALIPLIAIPLINKVLRGTVFHLSSRFQALLAEMSNFVQETFSGIRIVKGYHAEDSLLNKFYKYCDRFIGLNVSIMSFQGLTAPFLTMITRLTTTLIVIVAGYLILSGYEIISIADFVAFMWIQSYIYFPVLILGFVMPLYQQGRASYDRIKNLYEEPIDIEEGDKEDKIPF